MKTTLKYVPILFAVNAYLGNLCHKASDLSAPTYKINISLFINGMYFIRAKSGNEYITKKIIITKR